MRFLFLSSVVLLLLSGCSAPLEKSEAAYETEGYPSNQIHEVELKEYGLAPELTQSVWLNTEQPLQLADLGDKVILINFWTFG